MTTHTYTQAALPPDEVRALVAPPVWPSADSRSGRRASSTIVARSVPRSFGLARITASLDAIPAPRRGSSFRAGWRGEGALNGKNAFVLTGRRLRLALDLLQRDRCRSRGARLGG